MGNISFPGQWETSARHQIKKAIKTIHPNLCLLSNVTGSLRHVIGRLECLWLLYFYYLSVCTCRTIQHPSWEGWVLSVWGKKSTVASHSVVIFKRQLAKPIVVRLKHAEQDSLRGLPFLIQKISQRFTDVKKNKSMSHLPMHCQKSLDGHEHHAVARRNQPNLCWIYFPWIISSKCRLKESNLIWQTLRSNSNESHASYFPALTSSIIDRSQEGKSPWGEC